MTPNTDDEIGIETTDTSLTVQRIFDAPRESVWMAVTEPEHVDQWWGPEGFTTTTEEMDVRPGGVWTFEMTGPEGDKFPNQIVYNEVEPPERLVYTHGSPDDPEQFHVTVTFDTHSNNQTALTMTMQFPSEASLDEAIEFGADNGAKQTLGKLAEYLLNRTEDTNTRNRDVDAK